MREFLKAKIHGGVVTQAELAYEGSFGIDQDLMDQVGISAFEAIEIYNITNGNRLKTYAIPFPRGSKQLQSNGAAAHLIREGDKVIIAAYAWLNDQELQAFLGPKIALINEANEVKKFYQPDWRTGSAPTPRLVSESLPETNSHMTENYRPAASPSSLV